MTIDAVRLAIDEDTVGQGPRSGSTFRIDGDKLVHEIRCAEQLWSSQVPLNDGRHIEDLLGAWFHAYLNGVKPSQINAAPAQEVRFSELFCGPGGLALGFTQACLDLGMRPVSLSAADQDADALEIYARHNATRHLTTESVSMLVDYDIVGDRHGARFAYPPEVLDRQWAKDEGATDVLLAGPPCQGHSNLNNHTRRDDWRNELYVAVPAMAVALGVDSVIIENVKSVVNDRRGVVDASSSLLRSEGYQVETGILNAAEFGWPQSRERHFLVASRSAKPLPLEQVSALLHAPTRPVDWLLDVAAEMDQPSFMVQAPTLSKENQARINYLFDNDIHDLPNSERPICHQDGTTYGSVYGRLHGDQPAPTITTGFLTPGRGRYVHPNERRVMTAHEASLIQGFPGNYDFRPDGVRIPSKSQLTKWIGDAVPMPLGYGAALAALLAGNDHFGK